MWRKAGASTPSASQVDQRNDCVWECWQTTPAAVITPPADILFSFPKLMFYCISSITLCLFLSLLTHSL